MLTQEWSSHWDCWHTHTHSHSPTILHHLKLSCHLYKERIIRWSEFKCNSSYSLNCKYNIWPQSLNSCKEMFFFVWPDSLMPDSRALDLWCFRFMFMVAAMLSFVVPSPFQIVSIIRFKPVRSFCNPADRYALSTQVALVLVQSWFNLRTVEEPACFSPGKGHNRSRLLHCQIHW